MIKALHYEAPFLMGRTHVDQTQRRNIRCQRIYGRGNHPLGTQPSEFTDQGAVRPLARGTKTIRYLSEFWRSDDPETIKGDVDHIIDLSADFRLRDPALYADTYGRSHDFPDLLKTAVYGLTEYARKELSGADLVACPGCYPTCSLLSLLPGIENDMFELDTIIIDAKSGVTGAGRKAKEGLIYSEVADGAHAYAVGSHRHAPEIDQMLARVNGTDARVSFTPHLIPMNRGMIATTYVRLKPGIDHAAVMKAYTDRYADEPFVVISDIVPQTRHVRGSNLFSLGIFKDRVDNQLILVGVIDNLVKGSAGQAVQNYNVVQGWDETLGLSMLPMFP